MIVKNTKPFVFKSAAFNVFRDIYSNKIFLPFIWVAWIVPPVCAFVEVGAPCPCAKTLSAYVFSFMSFFGVRWSRSRRRICNLRVLSRIFLDWTFLSEIDSNNFSFFNSFWGISVWKNNWSKKASDFSASLNISLFMLVKILVWFCHDLANEFYIECESSCGQDLAECSKKEVLPCVFRSLLRVSKVCPNSYKAYHDPIHWAVSYRRNDSKKFRSRFYFATKYQTNEVILNAFINLNVFFCFGPEELLQTWST